MLGGATAWSGGWMWAPLNPLSQADGIVEDIDGPAHLPQARARRALRRAAGRGAAGERPAHGGVLREPHRAAVRLRHLDRRHPGRPARGRHRRAVGRPEADQRAPAAQGAARQAAPPQLYETSFLGMGIMAGPDLQAFLHATTSVRGVLPRRLAGRRSTCSTWSPTGRACSWSTAPALIARLAKSADDLGVQLWVSSPATRLLTEDGAVTGAVVATPDGEVDRPGAARRAARRRRLPATTSTRRRELFPRTPTGAGALDAGARRRPPATGSPSASRSAAGSTPSLASPAAWCPVSLVPYRSGRVGTYPHIVDRGKPGLIARAVERASGSSTRPTATTSSPRR